MDSEAKTRSKSRGEPVAEVVSEEGGIHVQRKILQDGGGGGALSFVQYSGVTPNSSGASASTTYAIVVRFIRSEFKVVVCRFRVRRVSVLASSS